MWRSSTWPDARYLCSILRRGRYFLPVHHRFRSSFQGRESQCRQGLIRRSLRHLSASGSMDAKGIRQPYVHPHVTGWRQPGTLYAPRPLHSFPPRNTSVSGASLKQRTLIPLSLVPPSRAKARQCNGESLKQIPFLSFFAKTGTKWPARQQNFQQRAVD